MVTKLVQKETEGKEAERMEKENRQRRKRNKKDIRNAFVMLCVTIAMMSTATFAWFTMTDSPTVQGLKMTAAATGGLELRLTASDAWSNSINVNTAAETVKLTPVSPTGATNKFGSPVYQGSKVTGVTEISDSDLSKYLAAYNYQIRAVGATANSPVKVGFLGGTKDSNSGSFIVEESTTSGVNDASYAIRVGFQIDGKWIIYEPNADGRFTPEGTKAVNEYTKLTSTIQQKKDGTFESTYGSGNVSNMIFELKDTNAHDIKMYIWLEGTDDQCVNEIQTDSLKGQIQFTVIK